LWRQTKFSAAQVAMWSLFRHTLLAELISCRTTVISNDMIGTYL